ncbi:MAG TPA: hypothetical protein VGL82_05015 [Bryobacteraceae bacterium]
MNPPPLQFFSFTLPIMVTLVVTVSLASWSRKKRYDDLCKRLDHTVTQLET